MSVLGKLDQQLMNAATGDLLSEWVALFTDSKGPFRAPLLQAFREIKKDLEAKGVTDAYLQQNGIEEYIRPAPEYILGAFKYAPPAAITTIILGEDPYPNKGVSDGMAFSMRMGTPEGTSIVNIVRCLQKQELITAAPDGSASLEAWALQGVLLLNRYLTRTPEITRNDKQIYIANNGSGKAHNLHKFWSKFTDAVMDYLITDRLLNSRQTLCIFGMGNVAKPTIERLRALVANHGNQGGNIHLYWWNHPSPRSTLNNNISNPQHFVNCPHFTDINNELAMSGGKSIDWSIQSCTPQIKTLRGYIVFATDGSCKPEGSGHVSGAAAVFTGRINGNPTLMWGKYNKTLYPYRYVLDKNDNEKNKDNAPVDVNTGVATLHSVPDVVVDPYNPAHHSNQRAELMGAIIGLHAVYGYLLQNPHARPYIWMVIDNTTVINYINYGVYDTEGVSASENHDLLVILRYFLERISEIYGVSAPELIEPYRRVTFNAENRPKYNMKWTGITTIHQRSHTSSEGLTGIHLELHALNRMADTEANSAAQ